MELMRLADQPSVEASALKDCVAQDPALACKLLRVVNSSFYGLHRPVADLNQAIGLIGIHCATPCRKGRASGRGIARVSFYSAFSSIEFKRYGPE